MHPVVRAAFGILAALDAGALPASGSAPSTAVGPVPAEVDFDRHVASLFGKLGCNAGSCHGSFQGRGGLNLSLFGHDPARDYQTLTRDAFGRRVDLLNPDRSLVLLKPTGQVPHEGGQRFAVGSWEYRVIRSWVAAGARRDPARAAAESIDVQPPELTLGLAGRSARVTVFARFADGSSSEVTPFCDVRARDDSVAEVSAAGEIRALRAGDTAIVATYRGLLASARVYVPTGRDVNIIYDTDDSIVDRGVNAKLRVLGVAPSGPSTDAEFLRRVTLDVIGTLPAPGDVRSFLDDPSPDKRRRKVEELLAHPMHAALWATKYLDVTGCDVDAMEGPEDLRPQRARAWHDWFRKRFAENMPYDQIARGVLCATSRGDDEPRRWVEAEAARLVALKGVARSDYAERPGLDLFWRRFANGEFVGVEPLAERVAAAFLGVRIECAQCHKHPFDRWTQTDYRGFANVFANVRYGLSPDTLNATARLLEERRLASPDGSLPPIPRLRELYVSAGPSRWLDDPATGRRLAPKALGGPELPLDGDPRERLFDWLTRADNPYFARSFVNRVWAAYFGAGLVDPVDGFSVANPPSNERLLDDLAADFMTHGYDIRRLERAILNSRAYQRSSAPSDGNGDDRGNYARAAPRTLMAEVLVDTLAAALGAPGNFGNDAPKGGRAVEVATNRVASPELARAFRVFGRPRRAAVCDCERVSAPSVPQTLFLMTEPALLAKIKAGRLRRLLDDGLCDAEVVEELFLGALSRFPDDAELRSVLDHLHGRPDREAALADVLWALINTREFVLNH
jgi:hypothetical protein